MPVLIVEGTVTVRSHCTFRWTQEQIASARIAERKANHCDACAGILGTLGFIVVRERHAASE